MKKTKKALKSVVAALLILSLVPVGGFSADRLSGTGLFAPPAAAASGAQISGCVYEAVKSNRVEGAGATLFCQDAAGNAVVWNAEAAGQPNPQVTDEAGTFRWNVPGGRWTVGITKANYKTAYSGWTTVPSGGKEVSVSLVTTAAPEVIGVTKKYSEAEKKVFYTIAFSQYMDTRTISTRNVVFTNNGRSVTYEMWAANREASAAGDGVFYASIFNFLPDKDVSALTVKDVKNYAGIRLKQAYGIAIGNVAYAVDFDRGDVDSDGRITAADARLALRASVGLYADEDATVSYDFSRGTRPFLAADYDSSGKLEAGDARSILRVAVGLELKESNSSLVTYTNLTNKHDKRNHKIDKITIHHMAEKRTAKQCCDYFTATDRDVSANYCIGYDGSIGMNVEEKYRAWTSSSEVNDMRAVTIEVSNDGGAPNWHVSDIALARLIDLCVDICLRNGIDRLVFTGDACGNLTMHKMFAATGCPGPYLGGRFPYIVQQVNARLAAQRSPA